MRVVSDRHVAKRLLAMTTAGNFSDFHRRRVGRRPVWNSLKQSLVVQSLVVISKLNGVRPIDGPDKADKADKADKEDKADKADKADAKLIVHADRPLALAIGGQRVKPAAKWRLQVVKCPGDMIMSSVTSRVRPGALGG